MIKGSQDIEHTALILRKKRMYDMNGVLTNPSH